MTAAVVSAVVDLQRVAGACWTLMECDTYAEDIEGALDAEQLSVAVTASRHGLVSAARALCLLRSGVDVEQAFVLRHLADCAPDFVERFQVLWRPRLDDGEAYCADVEELIGRVRAALPFDAPRVPDEIFKALGLGRAFLRAGELLDAKLVDELDWLHS